MASGSGQVSPEQQHDNTVAQCEAKFDELNHLFDQITAAYIKKEISDQQFQECSKQYQEDVKAVMGVIKDASTKLVGEVRKAASEEVRASNRTIASRRL